MGGGGGHFLIFRLLRNGLKSGRIISLAMKKGSTRESQETIGFLNRSISKNLDYRSVQEDLYVKVFMTDGRINAFLRTRSGKSSINLLNA